ncbi:hypothetical protein H0H92_002316 [Tricholoma furcatifolium]|nr:hypothetical protein H0H92_002316 [Tricholoma furcatifolium]
MVLSFLVALQSVHLLLSLNQTLIVLQDSGSGLWPRSISSSTGRFIWTVIAVVGIILLVCIFIVWVVLVRRPKKQQRRPGIDEELGFGQNSTLQPWVAFPPRIYDGVTSSQSPPPRVQEMIEDRTRPNRPPMLTVSPPEELIQKPRELIQKPRRVPVPHLSALPNASRWNGLPTSPHLVGLPSSPGFPASPRVQQPGFQLDNTSVPVRDFDHPVSPQSPPPPSVDQLSSPQPPHTPLSAGGLDRMMTQMELELRVDDEISQFKNSHG